MFRFAIGLILCLISWLSFGIDGFYLGGGMALNQTSAENIYKTYSVAGADKAIKLRAKEATQIKKTARQMKKINNKNKK